MREPPISRILWSDIMMWGPVRLHKKKGAPMPPHPEPLAAKPRLGSFPRLMIISLAPMLPLGSSDLPEGLGRASRLPIWSCTGWGLPCPLGHPRGGGLLPHRFTLARCEFMRTRPLAVCSLWHFPSPGRSSAKSLGVTQHPALRCSDFPPVVCTTGDHLCGPRMQDHYMPF